MIISTIPPIKPTYHTANGSERAPAPIAEDVKVKIEPLTEPGFISPKTLSVRLLLRGKFPYLYFLSKGSSALASHSDIFIIFSISFLEDDQIIHFTLRISYYEYKSKNIFHLLFYNINDFEEVFTLQSTSINFSRASVRHLKTSR